MHYRVLIKTILYIVWALLVYTAPSSAATYPLPPTGEQIVGALQTTTANRDETLLDLALRYDLGHNEIIAANPDIDPWLPPEGARITLPTRFILPDTPRQGIVINLPELRLYFYPTPPPGEPAMVVTYPISIGTEGRSMSVGISEISEKRVKPSWQVPESIRAEHAANGEPLPAIVPPGPDNPLGEYTMRLGRSSYMIHGTNRTFSIGMRISHGCIRLYPDDIAALFPQVPPGTPVRVINQPFKAGWLADELYVESHTPLQENTLAPDLSYATEMVAAVINSSRVVLNNTSWELARQAATAHSGVPVKILAAQPGSSLLRTAMQQRPGLVAGDTWWLQTGAFSGIENARRNSRELGTLPPQVSAHFVSTGDELCRVLIGPFAGRTDALHFSQQIENDKQAHSFLLRGSQLNGLRFCQTVL